jgi:hypothetical protein
LDVVIADGGYFRSLALLRGVHGVFLYRYRRGAGCVSSVTPS